MKTNNKFKIPTIYVAFGVSGDLFKKKILKSLYNLYVQDNLPKKFIVFGFSRRDWTHGDLRKYLFEIMQKWDKKNKVTKQEFLKHFFYFKGDFDNKKSFENLTQALYLVDNKWKFCSNKIFHLAVPPNFYRKILNNLKLAKLTKPCSKEEGWTRLMIEKPFGRDLKSAKQLDKDLCKFFKEEQIYRIDHYLAKEALQNILFFRFTNNLFENSWNSKYIKQINITILQTNKVDTRGKFYDGVGELRDMGQSHALQMLATTVMNNPKTLTAKNIREERYKVLKDIKVKDIKKDTKRGQYISYKKTFGVKKYSKTETYFKLRVEVNNSRWKGVPINIESGKATLPQNSKNISKIEILFKHPTPCFYSTTLKQDFRNKIEFELSPVNRINIDLWYKKAGLEETLEKKQFSFPYPNKNNAEDYEKLIYDCIQGEQTLFVSNKEVEKMWNLVDPIIKAWSENIVPLTSYKVGQTPKFR